MLIHLVIILCGHSPPLILPISTEITHWRKWNKTGTKHLNTPIQNDVESNCRSWHLFSSNASVCDPSYLSPMVLFCSFLNNES
ncbi:hypothetical protein FKM82_025152 [Ascaphus truei]